MLNHHHALPAAGPLCLSAMTGNTPSHPKLDSIEFVTGGDASAVPKATIVVLHGLGADGNDFVPIARELNLGAVGPVRFVFPHAPTRPVTVNGGHVMRAWYDIFAPFDPAKERREDEMGLRTSLAQIQAVLHREAARGVPPERTVLMGFSQGCAMALMVGVRAPQRLAGIVSLSGYLPLASTTGAERSAANQKTPIFMAHGQFDPVVPMQLGAQSRDALKGLGYSVGWHEYPMQHSVSAEEVAALNQWLLRVLAP